MKSKLLMGNEAIARGAVEAGLNFAAAYPGTPSSEIIGALAEWARAGAQDSASGFYTEWSVNEKVALEVAAGAAYAGAFALVAMKQVGLNVAADPLMSLSYIGVKGALVIVVADDPGPHSSQTEQDTRSFARFANLPVFDPTSPEEAFRMTQAAFELSHRYGMPVFLRPTTRVCHATAGIAWSDIAPHPVEGFVKDPNWVIFPRLSYLRHQWLEEQQLKLAAEFSGPVWNPIRSGDRLGIVAGGISYSYVCEAADELGLRPTLWKIDTPYPFPAAKAREFFQQVDRILVVEELDPVIEESIIFLAGQAGFTGPVEGKLNGLLPKAGEYHLDLIRSACEKFTGLQPQNPSDAAPQPPAPDLPVRPPVLCAGCPHRASFYAVKRGTRGRDAIYTGDIGCYTLGNAPPLSMVDTCLCMGAGLTIAQGLAKVAPERPVFAFIGDSTFFHTGIPGVINAVHNQHSIKIVVLDNGTTAMTGHQTHPGMGRTATGVVVDAIELIDILKAAGVKLIEVVNPFEQEKAEAAVRRVLDFPGVAAVVMRAPCVATFKPQRRFRIDESRCNNCRRCLRELGCPAFSQAEHPVIGIACYGCGLCAQICPRNAITEVEL